MPLPTLDYIHPDLRALAVEISGLTPDPKNARRHSRANLEAIRASLERWGCRKPIVVQRCADGTLVVRAGNGRLQVARELGWSHLPATVVAEGDAESIAFALADNRTAELAEWDQETLGELVVQVDGVDWGSFGWADLGAAVGDLVTPEPVADQVAQGEPTAAEVPEPPIPEPPAEPVTKVGDVVHMGPHVLHCGDCMDVLRGLPDNSVDAIVTDPPYGLSPDGRARTWDDVEALRSQGKGPKGGFMGREWDAAVPGVTWARECLRVLKPGGHLVAHSATRTVHRLACALEDAGFELRDTIAWVQYCLTDDTQILTSRGWLGIDDDFGDALALCYSLESGEYTWGEVQGRFAYGHDATVYRVSGDHGSHRVTGGHRLVVERGAGFAFQDAWEVAREPATRIPVVDDLCGLLRGVPSHDHGASHAQQDLLPGVCGVHGGGCTPGSAQSTTGGTPGASATGMHGVCQGVLAAPRMGQAGEEPALLQELQRGNPWAGPGCAPKSPRHVDAGAPGEGQCAVYGPGKPGLEGRCDDQVRQGQLCGPALCTLSPGVRRDGQGGRLRHGAPAGRGHCPGEAADAHGVRAPRESQSARQSPGEPGAVCEQRGPQTARVARHTGSDLVRVTPEHYTGRVWCIKVPTGAFVARTPGGKPFVTGNSGFPKSLDVSKAIDAAAGATREVVGPDPHAARRNKASPQFGGASMNTWDPGYDGAMGRMAVTAPATPEAQRWAGWGTALKPAHEPAVLARKPLSEPTVAANVLRWGTGALNIDACRYPDGDPAWPGPQGEVQPVYGGRKGEAHGGKYGSSDNYWSKVHLGGRWPANIYACPKPSTGEREAGTDGLPLGDRVYMGSSGRTLTEDGWMETHSEPRRRTNAHPTVKPTKLYRWLLRLVTPPGGTVLEPFGGSGTTLVAGVHEGIQVIAVEREPAYCDIIRARVTHALANVAG